jgi:hypothetical protein
MKKSLLSILTASLLVVGCQDYDDQFSSLESQISALATTVAGLSQVQSDLASLAGTVGSLATTVNGLGDQIDTAVSDGLTDIQENIDAINTAVADVASSGDVAALQEAVDASQDDLDDLLAASSVFTGNVTINSPATLDVYEKMGPALNIVNGNVSITATAEMDGTKLQTVVDNILTTVKDFTYSAGTGVATVTFLNLTGTQSLTIKQAGDYRFDNLTSATNIILEDAHSNKVGIIHFGSLTSVTSFSTDTASSNLIDFKKVRELHLTSLVRYPGNNLKIRIKPNSVLAQQLDDVNAAGVQSNITLDISGPANFNATNFKDGKLTFSEMGTVQVDGFEGEFVIKENVVSFSADKVTKIDVSAATELETLNITGAKDPDNSKDKSGPAISFVNKDDLSSITLAGLVGAVTLTDNASLTDIVISAKVDGKITIGDNTAATDGNPTLANVNLTDSQATAVQVTNNRNLETLVINTTFWAGTGASAKLDGDVTVQDNGSLLSLTVSSDKIENLTVVGNDDLATIDFTGLTVAGATGSPSVYIYDNDLSGTMVDGSDGDTNIADGKAGDLGSITTSSGMGTLKTYLTAVKAVAKSEAKVLFDTIDFTTEASASAEYTFATNGTVNTEDEELRVLFITPNTSAAAVNGTQQKRGFLIGYWDTSPVNAKFEIWANGTRLNAVDIRVDANPALTVANILTPANIARATAAGVTMGASVTGNASTTLSVFAAATSSTNEWTAGNTDTSVSSATVFTLKIGSITLTTTVATPKITKDPGEIMAPLVAAYQAITSTLEEVTFAAVTNTDAESTWALTSRDVGSGGSGVSVSLSVSKASTWSDTANSGTQAVGIKVGATRLTTDNATVGQDIVITIEDNDKGAILNSIGAVSANQASGTIRIGTTDLISTAKAAQTTGNRELTSTALTVSATNVGDNYISNVYPTESRGDVTIAEDGVGAVASNATDFSRIGWLN